MHSYKIQIGRYVVIIIYEDIGTAETIMHWVNGESERGGRDGGRERERERDRERRQREGRKGVRERERDRERRQREREYIERRQRERDLRKTQERGRVRCLNCMCMYVVRVSVFIPI